MNTAQNIGVNVWWTAEQNIIVDAENAKYALESVGFEDGDMPYPSRRAVVSRAVYSFQDRRHKDGRRVVEKAKETANDVVWGILDLSHKSREEVSYDQSTTVTFHKDNGRVEVNGSLSDEFHKQLERYTDAITDDDLRFFFRNVVGMCYGVAKRPTGGIYFVPERFQGTIEDAKRVVEKLGVNAKLYVERIQNGQQEREIVADSVEEKIRNDISESLNAVERIEKRVGCIQNHADKVAELEGMKDLYQQLLGQEAHYEELTEQIDDAANKISNKMAELFRNKPVQQPKPKKTNITRKPVGNIMDYVNQILDEENQALHYNEIANKLEEKGCELRETQTKTKRQWVQIQVTNAIRKGAKIQKLGKGFYQKV